MVVAFEMMRFCLADCICQSQGGPKTLMVDNKCRFLVYSPNLIEHSVGKGVLFK